MKFNKNFKQCITTPCSLDYGVRKLKLVNKNDYIHNKLCRSKGIKQANTSEANFTKYFLSCANVFQSLIS